MFSWKDAKGLKRDVHYYGAERLLELYKLIKATVAVDYIGFSSLLKKLFSPTPFLSVSPVISTSQAAKYIWNVVPTPISESIQI